MKKIGMFLLVLGLGIITWDLFSPSDNKIISPLVENLSQSQKNSSSDKIYDQYSFDNLSKRKYPGSQIKLEKVIKKEEKYISWMFSYLSDSQKVTGQLNLPDKAGKLPVIIMLRGYADKEIYFTGLGTRKAARVFAQNGFITLAPDFLGFGGSDSESDDILLNRFRRPITILNLIASVKNLPEANSNNIFLWAHSNGGQIALSILEISQKNYPTTLWAPVTKGFPGCILDYIDKENLTPDSQKVLEAVNNFEKTHDSKLYSTTNYHEKINALLQVQQGGADPWVPAEWQQKFVKKLKELNKKVDYYYYPTSDHNLKTDWDTVIEKDLEFFRSFLE